MVRGGVGAEGGLHVRYPQTHAGDGRPCIRYRNAPAAIEWLCHTFGFEKYLVVPGPNDTIAHAQLTFGNGMVMIGSVTDGEFDRLLVQPDECGGAETQTPCVIVADANVVYVRAKRPAQRSSWS